MSLCLNRTEPTISLPLMAQGLVVEWFVKTTCPFSSMSISACRRETWLRFTLMSDFACLQIIIIRIIEMKRHSRTLTCLSWWALSEESLYHLNHPFWWFARYQIFRLPFATFFALALPLPPRSHSTAKVFFQLTHGIFFCMHKPIFFFFRNQDIESEIVFY